MFQYNMWNHKIFVGCVCLFMQTLELKLILEQVLVWGWVMLPWCAECIVVGRRRDLIIMILNNSSESGVGWCIVVVAFLTLLLLLVKMWLLQNALFSAVIVDLNNACIHYWDGHCCYVRSHVFLYNGHQCQLLVMGLVYSGLSWKHDFINNSPHCPVSGILGHGSRLLQVQNTV